MVIEIVMDERLIDIHSHLLPGVDDGCADLGQSLRCARRLVEAGYGTACCTPHIWPSFPENRIDLIKQRVAELQHALAAERIPLRLIAGGEINLRAGIIEVPPDQLVTFGLSRRFALIDLWADRLPAHFEPSVRWMQSMGLTVIVAHPERMRAVQDDPGLAEHFRELGLLLQGNLRCLGDAPGLPTRETADRLLAGGHYFALASDTHGPESLDSRIRGLERVRGELAPEQFLALLRVNPAKVIA